MLEVLGDDTIEQGRGREVVDVVGRIVDLLIELRETLHESRIVTLLGRVHR